MNNAKLSIAISLALATTCGWATDLLARSDIAPAGVGLSQPEKEVRPTILSLSSHLGIVGINLENLGWKFERMDLNLVPNQASTLLYVNSSDIAAGDRALSQFLASFRGVLVLDSETLYTTGGEMRGILGDQKESPEAADKYLSISDGVPGILGKVAPGGTAIIVSMSSNRVYPVLVDENGNVNGAGEEHLESMLPLLGISKQNSEISARGKNLSADTSIDVVEIKDNYRAAARVFVDGTKTGDGRRWFIQTIVDTGDVSNACRVLNNLRCGIYPLANKNIFSTTITDSGVTTARVKGWVTAYSAFSIVYGGRDTSQNGARSFRPTAANWNNRAQMDDNSYEVSYTTGYPLGGIWSVAGFFDYVAGGIFGKPTTHRKSMQTWSGLENVDSKDYGSSGRAYEIESGVSLLSQQRKVYVGFLGPKELNVDRFNSMLATHTVANNEPFCDSRDVIRKPKMTWEGWQPSLSAVHEVAPGTRSFDNIARVAVKAGIRWNRQRLTYVWSKDSNPGGNTVCGNTNYRKNHWRLAGFGETQQKFQIDRHELPTGGTDGYEASRTLYVNHTQF